MADRDEVVSTKLEIDTRSATAQLAKMDKLYKDSITKRLKWESEQEKHDKKQLADSTKQNKLFVAQARTLKKIHKLREDTAKKAKEYQDTVEGKVMTKEGKVSLRGVSDPKYAEQVKQKHDELLAAQKKESAATKELQAAQAPARAQERMGDIAGGLGERASNAILGDKMGGGKAGEAATKALTEGFGGLLKTVEELTGVFELTEVVVTALTGPIGLLVLAIVALGKLLFGIDKAFAEFNKTMMHGVGAGGAGDMTQLMNVRTKLEWKNMDTSGFTHSLMLTKDQIDGMMGSLRQAGVSVKDLGDGVETSATASYDFGVSMEEATSMTADYYKSYGKSISSISDTFSALNSDIKDSGMTSTNFLSILQSVTAQMNLFLDSTKEMSKAISALGASGAYSQKQMGALMDSMVKGGTLDVEKGRTFMAVFGKTKTGQKEFVKIRKAAVKQLMEAKANNASQEEQLQIANKILAMNKAIKGNILDSGNLIAEGLTPLEATSVAMEASGVTSVENAQATLENGEKLALLAAKMGVSVDEAKLMVKGQQALYASFDVQKKTLKEGTTYMDWLLSAQGKDAQKQEAARADAERVAGMTTSKLKGLGEITNGLLSALLNVAKWIANFISNPVKTLTGKYDPSTDTLKTGMDQLSQDTQALIDTSRASMSAQAKGSAAGERLVKLVESHALGKGEMQSLAKTHANEIAQSAPPITQIPGIAAPGYVGPAQSVAGQAAKGGAAGGTAGGGATGKAGEIAITMKDDVEKWFDAQWVRKYKENTR